jgi:hypothetical protein
VPVNKFLDFARDGRAVWERERLKDFSDLAYPDDTLGRCRDIIRGDVYLEWIRWYAEGLIDPQRFSADYDTYGSLYEAVLEAVSLRLDNLTVDERRAIASSVARFLQWRIDVTSMNKVRRSMSLQTRKQLLELSGSPPRCWITGRIFESVAIDAFLGISANGALNKQSAGRPMYVDIYRPIGIRSRDLNIEVDHVFPLSRGGEETDNLRLACGWANYSKKHNLGLYEVPGSVRYVAESQAQRLSVKTLPQPFWVIRLLATRRRCENLGGCSATSDNAELTVAPISLRGAPTPVNLRVVCTAHDPIASERYVPVQVAAAAWGRSTSVDEE